VLHPFRAIPYELYGNLTTRTPDNSTSSTYTYDALDRTTRITHAFTGGNTRTFDYGYWPLSNNRKWAKRDNNKGDVFGYDLNDEVTATQLDILNPDTTAPGSPAGMLINYDANGNRTTVANNSVTDNYVTNDLNQYNARTSSPTSPGLYDPKGNTTTGLDGIVSTYDAQNRLLTVTKGSASETYKYDGINRQVSRTVGSGAPVYNVYDGWNLIAEYAPGGTTPSTSYVYGPSGLIKQISGSTSTYYYQDASGSTSHVADSTGALLEWYRYDLQGTPIGYDALNTQLSTNNFLVRHLFTGQQWYSNIGLYDLRNRYYSPDVGRFLQGDPIGFKGDATNLYRYCGNNPIMRSDPTGEDGIVEDHGNYAVLKAQPDYKILPLQIKAFEKAVEKYVTSKSAGRFEKIIWIKTEGPIFHVEQESLAPNKTTSYHQATNTLRWKAGPDPGDEAKLDAGHDFPHIFGAGHHYNKDRSDLMVGGGVRPDYKTARFRGESVQEMINNKGKGVTHNIAPQPDEGAAANGWGGNPGTLTPAQNSAFGFYLLSLIVWPSTGAETTNFNGQFQPDFAWFAMGFPNPDSPYPTGPLHSAWYGNHSWGH
jgi:RHS repeat-associated protein